jgi:lipopolysaccharide/colanic/teichoic acid biosynthesis glycosyltransferase
MQTVPLSEETSQPTKNEVGTESTDTSMAEQGATMGSEAAGDGLLLRPDGSRPRYTHRFYRVAKRTFDVLASTAGLLVLFPLMLLVAVAIVINDGFPFIFRQVRLGEGGRKFTIYKFRSMRKDAEKILQSRPDLMEEYQRTFKIENDPRLLKIGKFIRSTTIDELPQLINVLKGDMSIVGPRPIVPKEIEKYGDKASVYYAMKPGCAGLWQCSGRSDLEYSERIALDEEYYWTASLRRDLFVVWRTLLSIFQRKGAF